LASEPHFGPREPLVGRFALWVDRAPVTYPPGGPDRPVPALIPHLSLPFRFQRTPTGQRFFPVTEQDTLAEIGDCVELAIRTEQGERRTLPQFGRPRQLTFLTDHELIRTSVAQTIADNEPRARDLVRRTGGDWSDPGMQRLSADWYLP
jgi:hypothetical protein